MHRLVPIRLIAVAVAMVSSIVLPLSVSASAAAAAVPQCKKLVSPPPVKIKGVLTGKSAVSVCSPVASIGASGKQVVEIGIKVNGKTITRSTTTWASGKGTTIQTLVYKVLANKGNCPAGSVARFLVTGTVTGGTNKAIPKGAKTTANLCIAKNNSATLAPGTVVKY
jgi:hypothetical protein